MVAAMTTKIEDLMLNITEEIHVKAPLDVTFEALLEQIGPSMTQLDNKPMPMKVEAWPGGRWYRVRVRDDGRRKLYRTNAELIQVKERAEAKLARG